MRRIGSSLVLLMALFLPAIAEKKKNIEPYALVAGTVFREPGFALPGAEVTVTSYPEEGQAAAKVKKMQALSDARGEFAFRVPPVTMRYTVRVTAKGYHPEEKSVSVSGEQRADATFELRPESK
jgi:hypothetical protein